MKILAKKSTAFLRRYNTLATNAQTLNVNLSQHVLYRSKAEILHVLEALISLDTAAAEIKVSTVHTYKTKIVTTSAFARNQGRVRIRIRNQDLPIRIRIHFSSKCQAKLNILSENFNTLSKIMNNYDIYETMQTGTAA